LKVYGRRFLYKPFQRERPSKKCKYKGMLMDNTTNLIDSITSYPQTRSNRKELPSLGNQWFLVCKTMGLLVFLLIFSLSAIPINGQVFQEPYSNVMFSYTLADFYQLLQTGNEDQIPTGVLFLLGGTITSVTVLDTDPSNYYVDLEMLDAHWVDSNTLESFEAYAVILDYSFSTRVSEVQDTRSFTIAPQARGMFLMEYFGPTESIDGTLVPVFILVDFKRF
jgi:hypothetical protein